MVINPYRRMMYDVQGNYPGRWVIDPMKASAQRATTSPRMAEWRAAIWPLAQRPGPGARCRRLVDLARHRRRSNRGPEAALAELRPLAADGAHHRRRARAGQVCRGA